MFISLYHHVCNQRRNANEITALDFPDFPQATEPKLIYVDLQNEVKLKSREGRGRRKERRYLGSPRRRLLFEDFYCSYISEGNIKSYKKGVVKPATHCFQLQVATSCA